VIRIAKYDRLSKDETSAMVSMAIVKTVLVFMGSQSHVVETRLWDPMKTKTLAFLHVLANEFI
jgi:hypothetical protein